MPGLLISLLVCGVSVLIGNQWEVAYLRGTWVLYWWYLIWSVPMLALAALSAFGITLVSIGGGASIAGNAGAIAGLGFGGIAGIISGAILLVRRALMVIGADLLFSALTLQSGGYVMDQTRLTLGAVMVLIPILIGLLTRKTSKITTTAKRARQ